MARKRQRGNGRGTLIQRNVGGVWIAKWYDHNGQRRERSTRTTDKRAAERILSKWCTDATLRRENVIDARAETLAQQARRPLSEHLTDFEKALQATGSTPKHVSLVLARARKVVDGAGFKRWADISASRVMEYVYELRADKEIRNEAGEVVKVRRGISAQTFNFYLQAMKQFGRWMVKDRRAADSPLAHLEGLNVKTDRRHDRRALTVDELRRLLKAAEEGDEIRRMGGAERAMLYRLSVETGLRAGELRSLTPASFKLDGDAPTVTVAAAYSKRRREDVLPLRTSMVAELHGFLARRLAGTPVFRMPAPEHLSKMFRSDVTAAGIDYRDDAGRVVDFHALRHTFITNLAIGGVHPKTAQSLARHSTITLTMDRYTHRYAGDDAAALDVLPDLSAPPTETAKATGTDDAPVSTDSTPASSPTSSSAKPRVPDASRCDEANKISQQNAGGQDACNPCKPAGLDDTTQRDATTRENGGGGIRTPETLTRLTVFKTVAFSRSATPPTGDALNVHRASTCGSSVSAQVNSTPSSLESNGPSRTRPDVRHQDVPQ